jgi:hypothetical protein
MLWASSGACSRASSRIRPSSRGNLQAKQYMEGSTAMFSVLDLTALTTTSTATHPCQAHAAVGRTVEVAGRCGYVGVVGLSVWSIQQHLEWAGECSKKLLPQVYNERMTRFASSTPTLRVPAGCRACSGSCCQT